MNEQKTPPSLGNVLVVDDDKFFLDTYVMKFYQAGFNVHGSLSAAEGLEVLRKGFAADAVLFSLVMHGSDGAAFLETMKKEKLAPRAAKIALANDMSEGEKAKISEFGAARCIIKASTMPSEVVDCTREEIGKLRT